MAKKKNLNPYHTNAKQKVFIAPATMLPEKLHLYLRHLFFIGQEEELSIFPDTIENTLLAFYYAREQFSDIRGRERNPLNSLYRIQTETPPLSIKTIANEYSLNVRAARINYTIFILEQIYQKLFLLFPQKFPGYHTQLTELEFKTYKNKDYIRHFTHHDRILHFPPFPGKELNTKDILPPYSLHSHQHTFLPLQELNKLQEEILNSHPYLHLNENIQHNTQQNTLHSLIRNFSLFPNPQAKIKQWNHIPPTIDPTSKPHLLPPILISLLIINKLNPLLTSISNTPQTSNDPTTT